MPETIPDLWPKEVSVDVVTPLAVLRHQAGLLRKRTNNLLRADVQSERGENEVVHHFELIAPALDHYRYRLFSVRHPFNLVYPSLIEAPEFDEPEGYPVASTQGELLDLIKGILQSTRTTSVIHSLIAQINEAHGKPEPPEQA